MPFLTMLAVLACLTLARQFPGLGDSTETRIHASLAVLGTNRQGLLDKFGKASAAVESNSVWVYGPWTPSPRIGFTCSFVHEVDGAHTLFDGVQYVSGSIAKPMVKALTVAQSIFGDGLSEADERVGLATKVARDFAWVSGEKTTDLLTSLKAENVAYYAQEKDPKIVLATCTVGGKNVYLFSRPIDGDVIKPVFAWDVKDGAKTRRLTFDASKLDVYSFSVGYCTKWQYTAGYTMEAFVGPGSFADTSLSDEKWIELK